MGEILETYLNSASKDTSETDFFLVGQSLLTSVITSVNSLNNQMFYVSEDQNSLPTDLYFLLPPAHPTSYLMVTGDSFPEDKGNLHS